MHFLTATLRNLAIGIAIALMAALSSDYDALVTRVLFLVLFVFCWAIILIEDNRLIFSPTIHKFKNYTRISINAKITWVNTLFSFSIIGVCFIYMSYHQISLLTLRSYVLIPLGILTLNGMLSAEAYFTFRIKCKDRLKLH